jgi:multicomponent Na+:H+ antiporter subunit B
MAVGLEVVGGLSTIIIFMFLGMRYVMEGGEEGSEDDK